MCVCAGCLAGLTYWTHQHCNQKEEDQLYVLTWYEATVPLRHLSVCMCRLPGWRHPLDLATLQQCQRKRIAAVDPMSDLSVCMCRLLGRCHPLDPSTLQPEAVPENMTDQVCNPVQSSGTYDCGAGYVCLNGDYEAFYVSTSCQA